MRDVALEDGALTYAGALDFDRSPAGLVPRRLPAWTRPQIPDFLMDAVVQIPSGVRLKFTTTASTIEMDVLLTLLHQLPHDIRPAVFDLVVDGELAQQRATAEGNAFVLGAGGPGDITYRDGEPATIVFDDLGSEQKVVELWLPQAAVVALRALRIDDAAELGPSTDTGAPRWIHYGSSISHCIEADSPTGTWPAVAARKGGVELLSFGFGGQCMLDQFVARTIRDQPADMISLKVGINIVNGDTLRDRTFGPALHGFIDTIREGHPATPMVLISPIFCPSAETHPGPTIMGPQGRYITVSGLEELRLTCLTLTRIRSMISDIVSARSQLGDANLHYLNGLELFGPDDAGDMPDDLHPNAGGYARMGDRFARLALGAGGPLRSVTGVLRPEGSRH
jgi:lysophospholipase L1-like esterase